MCIKYEINHATSYTWHNAILLICEQAMEIVDFLARFDTPRLNINIRLLQKVLVAPEILHFSKKINLNINNKKIV